MCWTQSSQTAILVRIFFNVFLQPSPNTTASTPFVFKYYYSLIRANIVFLVDIIKDKPALPPAPPRRSRKVKECISSSTESDDPRVLFHEGKHDLSTNGVMEWKYRGRSGSEVTANEPLSAPADIAVQKSEGFQRFFKAVVSPTHVRVTAGGRIVPNTRATTSPTSKWDKHDTDRETRGSVDTTKNGNPRDENVAKGNVTSQVERQVFPPHPVLFQHPGVLYPQFFPMHNGIPLAYGFPHPQLAMSSSAPPGSTHAKVDPAKPTSRNRADDGVDANKLQSNPVKVAATQPPDYTKLPYPNGYLGYPTVGAAATQSDTPTLVSNPYVSQRVPGNQTALPTGRMVPMGQANHTMPVFGAPGFASVPLGASQVPQQLPHHVKSAVAPPISSIKPSEITKHQLSQLRNAAKYYEDQLLYNKHQIDEKSTEAQVEALKFRIGQFEYALKMQVTFENLYYPRQTQSSETATAASVQETAVRCDTPSRPPSTRENRSANVSQDGSVEASREAHSLRPKEPTSRPRPQGRGLRERNSDSTNAFRNDSNSSAALDALEAQVRLNLELEKEKKASSLSRAALAPPFQPVPGNDQNGAQPWLAGQNGDYQWLSTNAYSLMQPRGRCDPSTGVSLNPGSVPYLVGTLQQGVNPYTAQGTDYTYARELTVEEIRARHIYWGGVSLRGTGLPKFDGKDFYPPSPVKAKEEPRAKSQLPRGHPDSDYGFQVPSTKNDPFRSSRDGASIRSQESTQKVSHAIPIVNPDSVGRGSTNETPKPSGRTVEKAFNRLKLATPPVPAAEAGSDKKSNLSRRAIDRSR